MVEHCCNPNTQEARQDDDDDDNGSDKMAQGVKVLVVLVPRTQSGRGELTSASFPFPLHSGTYLSTLLLTCSLSKSIDKQTNSFFLGEFAVTDRQKEWPEDWA